jgi:hypothetical protein
LPLSTRIPDAQISCKPRGVYTAFYFHPEMHL